MSSWQFWVDRGGTFTDIVGRKPDGSLITHKLLSENPEQYADAAVQGIRELMGLRGDQEIPKAALESVKMGTTVATNALLERKGERTLLLITAGFEDLLRIGYQNRPDLFSLNIQLPSVLYERVLGVHERFSAQGDVLADLNTTKLRRDLEAHFKDGIRSVAIAFAHGYRYPAHEVQAEKLARDIGFTQVSVSHKVSPLVKLVSRGDTTVADAYLSPILKKYVDQVRSALVPNQQSQTRLMFMQSSGGLTDASLFEGKDAILSGPAGGVVGMVRSAQNVGFNQLIGFDMGGTSTDVCHFDGEYERTFETEVAGVRMRTPMLSIHTVAAGGGSILKFEDGRFQVGPESAGANPGPAGYRRGGPLTVTDCNILLGKLQPDHFPHVFGPNANLALDVHAVRKKFSALADDIAEKTGEPKRPVEEIAEGFLRIAVENMANAIKKISVQKGYDVTRYTLNCFGGAGGQHACMVADQLGMESVYVHPFAGVLSAFGMGLADISANRQHQFDRPLSQLPLAADTFEFMRTEALEEVIAQGIDANLVDVKFRVHVRTQGSHQTMAVDCTTKDQVADDFQRLHLRQFGFKPPTVALVVDMLEVEVVGKTGQSPQLSDPEPSTLEAGESKPVYFDQTWRQSQVLSRENLGVGQTVTGPCILTELTGTTMVEPGWIATCLAGGDLHLTRQDTVRRQNAVGTRVDPIMLEVFNNQFMSIADQMGATLENTAYSVNIKERLDFSCALFDHNGNLVANAPHVPVHLGSMSESVKTILEENKGKIQDGDVFMMNNPFNGGTHLPDVTVITPVLGKNGDVICVLANRGHHADIGGKTPGSAPPDSRHIAEEGVVIDNFKLVDQGNLREWQTRQLLRSGDYPCRNPDQNIADLKAQVAANNSGLSAFRKLVEHYGLDVIHAYMTHVQDNAEACVRDIISVLEDCCFTQELDFDAKISVRIAVDRKARTATVDFTGTSPQQEFNYNAPASITRAVVLYVFRTLVGKNIPMNEGCLTPIKIISPKGSMINPEYPAAVISGNTEVSQAIAEALFGALGVIAGSQGTMNNFVYGNDSFQNYETICGGTGAGPGFDGASAVHSHMTNTRMTDVEVLENRFPVQVDEFRIRTGSGGQGTTVGGNGISRTLTFLEPTTVTVLSSNRSRQPHGANGGKPGQSGTNFVTLSCGKTRYLKGNDQCHLEKGDAFTMETPGGGGFGVPAGTSS